jgi:hypothetical protein
MAFSGVPTHEGNSTISALSLMALFKKLMFFDSLAW